MKDLHLSEQLRHCVLLFSEWASLDVTIIALIIARLDFPDLIRSMPIDNDCEQLMTDLSQAAIASSRLTGLARASSFNEIRSADRSMMNSNGVLPLGSSRFQYLNKPDIYGVSKSKTYMNISLEYGNGFYLALIGVIVTNVATLLYLSFKKIELSGPTENWSKAISNNAKQSTMRRLTGRGVPRGMTSQANMSMNNKYLLLCFLKKNPFFIHKLKVFNKCIKIIKNAVNFCRFFFKKNNFFSKQKSRPPPTQMMMRISGGGPMGPAMTSSSAGQRLTSQSPISGPGPGTTYYGIILNIDIE